MGGIEPATPCAGDNLDGSGEGAARLERHSYRTLPEPTAGEGFSLGLSPGAIYT
jgi:hypothetical protein